MKDFYTDIAFTEPSYQNSDDFVSLFSRANQQLKSMLRSSMKDGSGNIVNYGFKHEIVQAISNLNFKYRTWGK